jgi:hypothetical protein
MNETQVVPFLQTRLLKWGPDSDLPYHYFCSNRIQPVDIPLYNYPKSLSTFIQREAPVTSFHCTLIQT